MITIKVNTKDLKINVAIASLENLHVPIGQALAYLELETKTQFISQSDPDGKRWADLKPQTWARKKSQSILRETSLMINSISTRVSGSHSGEISVGAEYAIYHQEGTSKMEARPILGVTEKRIERMQDIFERYIGGMLGGL